MSKQDNINDGECIYDYRSESGSDEPDVMTNVTSPPVDITKYVHRFLEDIKGEHVERQDSAVIMDVWDFSGQHLYYASHPLFLSSRALYILVHNLSKPLHAPAKPCVRQGTHNILLEKQEPGKKHCYYLIKQPVS